MFFIHRGEVDVVSEDGKMVFDTMKPGRFFGEISLVMSCPRTASIRYLASHCVLIFQDQFMSFAPLSGYPVHDAFLHMKCFKLLVVVPCKNQT